MKTFVACRGKTACLDDGNSCRTCGRDTDEIRHTRAAIESLSTLVTTLDYDNYTEFARYIADKAIAKVRHRREERLHAATMDRALAAHDRQCSVASNRSVGD
jgi:hypothetical protein